LSEQLSLFGDDISLSDVDAARRRTRVIAYCHEDEEVPLVTLPPPLQELTPDDWALLQTMLWRAITGEGGERTTVTPIPEPEAATGLTKEAQDFVEAAKAGARCGNNQ
jgi:hypothetical protein